jgi:hypothetical protein
MSLTVSFQKMDLDLGAVIIDTELTRLGANCFGAKVQGHFLRVIDVSAYVAWTWHELGAVDLGAELDTICYGAELLKLTHFNFYHDLDIEKCGKLRVFTVTCCLITENNIEILKIKKII